MKRLKRLIFFLLTMWNVSLMEIINGKLVNFSSSFAIENIRSDLILKSSFFYFFFFIF